LDTYNAIHCVVFSNYPNTFISIKRCWILVPEQEPRLVRDLILGALNAVSLAGQPSDDIAAALQALLGLPQAKRSERRDR
jgi:hypothetical protein